MEFTSKNKWLFSAGSFPSGCPMGEELSSQKSVLCFLMICKSAPRKGFQGPPDTLCIWDGEEVCLLTRSMRRAAVAGWVRMPAVEQELCASWIFCSFFFLFFSPSIKFSLQGKAVVEATSGESSADVKALCRCTHDSWVKQGCLCLLFHRWWHTCYAGYSY